MAINSAASSDPYLRIESYGLYEKR